MPMYVSDIPVGKRVRKVVTINHKLPRSSVSVDRMHHVLLLDRSHSMSGEIAELMDDVKCALSSVHPEDLVSIIWFSGPGQSGTIVQGARVGSGLDEVLDSLKSTVGTTCFSEPLAAAKEIVRNLKPLCQNFAVTLFTDGCPVVPWGEEEEKRRIMEIVSSIRDETIAVNCIGYGSHYNQELLREVAALSEYGVFNHSGKISDYSRLFGHNLERMADLALASLEVASPGAEILYLGDRNTKMVRDELRLRLLSRRRNQIFIVGPDEKDFSFVYDGKTYDTASIRSPKLNVATVRNFLYALAYNFYYAGRREESLEVVLHSLGDRALVDSHMSSFTWSEVESHANRIRRAVFETKARYADGVCDETYLPREDAPCLMDVFRVLARGENFFVAPIGNGKKYRRIGKKTVDVFGHTELAESEVVDRFDTMVLNEDRFNVSFRVQVPIFVHLNPRAADRVGLPRSVRAKQYRTFAIIRDGAVNMPEVEAILDAPTFDKLSSMGLRMRYVRDEAKGRRVLLDMASLPVISRRYTNVGMEEVFRTVKDVTELRARQKVLGFFLKNVQGAALPEAVREEGFAVYTPEQILVLREHGINERFEYSPVQTATEEVGESYVTRSLDFDMKGFASLPKVEDVIERMRTGARLTPVQQLLATHIEDVGKKIQSAGGLSSPETKKYLREELRETKIALLEKRMFLSTVKMGKILTGSWFENLEPDGKGNFLYKIGEFVLVVKPKREIVTI